MTKADYIKYVAKWWANKVRLYTSVADDGKSSSDPVICFIKSSFRSPIVDPDIETKLEYFEQMLQERLAEELATHAVVKLCTCSYGAIDLLAEIATICNIDSSMFPPGFCTYITPNKGHIVSPFNIKSYALVS